MKIFFSKIVPQRGFTDKLSEFSIFLAWPAILDIYSHGLLITCERLIAIKYANHYLYIVRKRNFKVLVLAIWSFSFMTGVLRYVENDISKYTMKVLHFFTMYSSVIFILIAYIILYPETLRHRKRIIKQQLPQAEIERFVKENKALKTTVLVVSAIALCFLPMTIYISALDHSISKAKSVLLFSSDEQKPILTIVVRTLGMLNSLANPVIYCIRQREMRKFVFRSHFHAVYPMN